MFETTSLSGEPLSLQVPDRCVDESIFFMAPHKSGSVLFYNLVDELAAAAQKQTFALEPQLFGQGVPLIDCPLEVTQLLEQPGLYNGFRTLWLLPYVRGFREAKKLLLVRDPRDICVSYYFSVTQSHTVPEKGSVRSKLLNQRSEARDMNIDRFIRSGRCDFVLNNMMAFKRVTEQYENCHIFRYEDVIFQKQQWAQQIADLCGLEVSPEAVAEIAARHDIRPDDERPDQHVRQVSPGNYKRHLRPETWQVIEKRFKPLFDYFDYPIEAAA
ncbi:MAG: sulfotransferase domain-containing protein [Henriciella sp.]